jgi:hypothetical protein
VNKVEVSEKEMNIIVDHYSFLEWDGWTAVEYCKGDGYMKPDGKYHNGEWKRTRRYSYPYLVPERWLHALAG